MDYSLLHWHSDCWLSEIRGIPYDEMENDKAIGLYSMKDFPDVYVYIDVEENKIIEAWVVAD